MDRFDAKNAFAPLEMFPLAKDGDTPEPDDRQRKFQE